jgi:hypothetical protein
MRMRFATGVFGNVQTTLLSVLLVTISCAYSSADPASDVERLYNDAARSTELAYNALAIGINAAPKCQGDHLNQPWKNSYEDFTGKLSLVEAEAEAHNAAAAAVNRMAAIGGIQNQPNMYPVQRERWAKLRLSLADMSLKRNCLALAEEQFRAVLKYYPEPTFAGYRDQAK